MKRYIPNSLTVLRFLLALVFPFVPESWRIPIFVVAAITEFSDGYLSRRWGVVTKWGKLMDPVADKAFVFAVIVTLFLENYVELWELAVVGIRDVVVFAGAAWVWLLGDRADFDRAEARIPGKLATNLQFLFLLVALVLKDVPLALVLVTGIFSAAAAVDYVRFYVRDVRGAA